jgi:hypothetical protein
MKGVQSIFILYNFMLLAGCGTYTPDIQEFWGTRLDAAYKVNKVSAQVVCELRRAVQRVLAENKSHSVVFGGGDPQHPPPKYRDLKWFESWSTQVTLTLNVAENSSLTPGVSINSILPNAVTKFANGSVTTGQSYSTGLGANLSSTATRVDKLNMFFTVKELESPPSVGMPCIPPPQNADLFVQSDLKLYDWLSAALLPYDVSIINYANNSTAQNAISHDVKFEIVSNGNVNPTWKLVNIAANTAPALFAAGRDRSQDLDITFGPTQKGANGTPELATTAQNSHLAEQIGLAVAQALNQ